MLMNIEAHQKITAAHLSRLAYLYVRQFNVRQSSRTPRALTASMRFGSALSRWAGRPTGSSSSTAISGSPAPARLTGKAFSAW